MNPSLADWASIAEIVGAVVVTLSLVFIGVQIKRNTVATQAATLQGLVANDVQILTAVGSTGAASTALFKYSFEPTGLTEEQLVQGRWLFASTVRHWENLYLQRLGGTLSENAWAAREPALRALISCPGWEEYTSSVLGHFMGGPFMAYAGRVRALVRVAVGASVARDSS